MSDERREVAWRKWWGDRGFNPAHHLAFNEGWNAGCDEMETKLDAAQEAYRLQEQRHIAIRRLAEDANTSLIAENIRLKAALRKARETLDDDASIVARLIELLPARKRDWASSSIAGPCQTNIREALAEIDAVLDEK